MRRISCWNDLAPSGIIPLTGESCGLGYRILFDVTEQGRAVIGRWLGIPGFKLAEPWNRGSDSDPHVGSILLSPESLIPLSAFALFAAGYSEVWLIQQGVIGLNGDDSAQNREWARAHYKPTRILKPQGTAGERNVHQMSGRVT
jgi:hypothetical protein